MPRRLKFVLGAATAATADADTQIGTHLNVTGVENLNITVSSFALVTDQANFSRIAAGLCNSNCSTVRLEIDIIASLNRNLAFLNISPSHCSARKKLRNSCLRSGFICIMKTEVKGSGLHLRKHRQSIQSEITVKQTLRTYTRQSTYTQHVNKLPLCNSAKHLIYFKDFYCCSSML